MGIFKKEPLYLGTPGKFMGVQFVGHRMPEVAGELMGNRQIETFMDQRRNSLFFPEHKAEDVIEILNKSNVGYLIL